MDLERPSQLKEHEFLLRWVLKRHVESGGGCVDEHGVPVRCFVTLDVLGLHAEAVVAAVEAGGVIHMGTLKTDSASVPVVSPASSIGHSNSTHRSTPSVATSRSPTPPSDTNASLSQASLASLPQHRPTDTTYPPVLLRRHVFGDVRPYPPWSTPLPSLRDELVPNRGDRVAYVVVAAYEAVLIANGCSSGAVEEIAVAFRLPENVVRGTEMCLRIHSSSASHLEALKKDVRTRIACLFHTFRHPRKAMEAFGGEGPLLRDFRMRQILFLCDCAMYRHDDVAPIAKVLQNLVAMSGSVNKHDCEWDGLERSVKALFTSSSAVPPAVASELYSALLTSTVANGDDVTPLSPDILQTAAAPLRKLWHIDDAHRSIIRAALFVEVLTFEGGADAATCSAVGRILRSVSAPLEGSKSKESNETQESSLHLWLLHASAVFGHIYKAFLIKCRTLSASVLSDALWVCTELASLLTTEKQRGLLQNHLLAVMGRISGNLVDLEQNDVFVDVKGSAASWTKYCLCSYAVWHSATAHWRSLVKDAEKELIKHGPVRTTSLSQINASEETHTHPAALPHALLPLASKDLTKYSPLIKAAKIPSLTGVTTGCYLNRVVDLLLQNLGKSAVEFDLDDKHCVQFLKETGRFVRRHEGNKCPCVRRAIQRYSAKVRPAAEVHIKRKHQAMTDYAAAATGGTLTWSAEDGARQVIPEVIDVFACLNECVSDTEVFFYKGASTDIQHLAQAVSGNVQVIVTAFTDLFPLTSGDDPTQFNVVDMPMRSVVLALNSLALAREEYLSSVQRLQSAWKDVCPFLGDKEFVLTTGATLCFLEDREGAAMRALAEKVTLSCGWRTDLYSIDLKHYKKHKADKGYLAKNGPGSHLQHSSVVTVSTVLDAIDANMTNALPLVTSESMRLTVAKLSLDCLMTVLSWVFLGDSSTEKHGRFFHEDHTQSILTDLAMVEHFYAADGSVCGGPYEITLFETPMYSFFALFSLYFYLQTYWRPRYFVGGRSRNYYFYLSFFALLVT